MRTLRKIIQKRPKELKQNSHMSKMITLCRTLQLGKSKMKEKKKKKKIKLLFGRSSPTV